jgi:phenylalanyl-tRNA synthetase alpha chain
MSEEQTILAFLDTHGLIEDTFPWSESNGFDHLKVVGAIKSLLVDEYVVAEDLSASFYTLTSQGQEVLEKGSQEYQVLAALREAGKLSLSDLDAKVGGDVSKIGMANCMKNKWIKKDGGDLVPIVEGDVEDTVQKLLLDVQAKQGNVDLLDDKVCRKRESVV